MKSRKPNSKELELILSEVPEIPFHNIIGFIHNKSEVIITFATSENGKFKDSTNKVFVKLPPIGLDTFVQSLIEFGFDFEEQYNTDIGFNSKIAATKE